MLELSAKHKQIGYRVNNSAYFEVLNPSMQIVFPGAGKDMSTSNTKRV
jgi:hypothetical protein